MRFFAVNEQDWTRRNFLNVSHQREIHEGHRNSMKVYTDYHPVINMLHQKTKQRWLVRPSRRIADVNQSTVSHVVISKIPDAKEISAEKAVVATLTTPSLATE